eukprot:CAMPEP_0113509478 /NCGR_PEP_ID=MMETSP0014_2-20120614/37602_1 /TAXON_ID=2857 /ORGANISM="Nitzschia sp." /LENGTH=572 /DNA_ID=CAMNT_0000405321 /DNA_START=79 /DNA_END=1797 /DNA_ORIENTATION=- /assembly_acc=CAM_ASM_000159
MDGDGIIIDGDGDDKDEIDGGGGGFDTSPPSTPPSSTTRGLLSSSSINYHHFLHQNWKILVLGQVVSFCYASGGAMQATLFLDCGLSAPTFSVALIYLGISFNLIYHVMMGTTSQDQQPLYSSPPSLKEMNESVTVNNHSNGINRQKPRGGGRQRQNQPTLDGLYRDNERGSNSRGKCEDDSDDDDDFGSGDALPSTLSETNGSDDDHNPVISTGFVAAATDDENNKDEDELEEVDASIPAPFPSYSFFFGYVRLSRPVWWYFVLAFFDVQANAITLLAYRYTTITSITLFDALAIPSAMVISRWWLQRKYRPMHYVGVVICMVGVVVNVLQDYESDVADGSTDDDGNNNNNNNTLSEEAYPHKLWGDICAIIGGLLYGLNDTLTEITVQNNAGTSEYLGMMGFFAFWISIIQAFILEWDDILELFGEDTKFSSTCSLQKGWTVLLSFVILMILTDMAASRFLLISEAAFFNLSVLTGDLWSVVFSVFAEKIVPGPNFFVALVLVLSGVVVYEMVPSPAMPTDKSYYVNNNSNDTIEFSPDLQTNGIISSGDERADQTEEIGIEMKQQNTIF